MAAHPAALARKRFVFTFRLVQFQQTFCQLLPVPNVVIAASPHRTKQTGARVQTGF